MSQVRTVREPSALKPTQLSHPISNIHGPRSASKLHRRGRNDIHTVHHAQSPKVYNFTTTSKQGRGGIHFRHA